MKKLSIVSMIGAAALSALALTGCPTTNPDAEYLNSATAIFAVGKGAKFEKDGAEVYWSFGDDNWAHAQKMTEGDNHIFTAEIEAVDPKVEFKILIDELNWSNQAHNGPDEIVLDSNGKSTPTTWVVSDGGMANPWFKATIGSKYRITVDGTSLTAPKVTVEQTSASITPTLQMFLGAVPYDLTFDGTTYTTTVTATEDGVAKFLFKDSNGNYWSKKAAVALKAEVTLASSAEVPAVTSIDSVQEGCVYQFTATPTFNGDGDEISSMKLKVVALPPITAYKYIVGGFAKSTVDTDVYAEGGVADGNTFYTLSNYVENDTTASASFVFTNYTGNGWGVDGAINFKLAEEVGWSKCKGSSKGDNDVDGEIGDIVLCDGGSNIMIEGLVTGKDYKLTVITTSTTVSVKIEELN